MCSIIYLFKCSSTPAVLDPVVPSGPSYYNSQPVSTTSNGYPATVPGTNPRPGSITTVPVGSAPVVGGASRPSFTADYPSVPTTPPVSRPGVHDAVKRAVNAPDQAYFDIEDQLEGNADINAVDSSGQTALHVAASLGMESIVEMLLEKGAKINAMDKSGHTPLHLAAKHGKKDAVHSLLIRGATVDPMNNDGLTPLVYAVSEGLDPDIVRDLLENGADPNAHIFSDGNVLHFMVTTPKMEGCAMEAVRRGADMKAKDSQGNTPLHQAAYHGKISLIEFLLIQDPELVTIKNNRGQNPIQYAQAADKMEAVMLLHDWQLRQAGRLGDVPSIISAVSSGADLGSPLDSFSNTIVHEFAERNFSMQLSSLSEALPDQLDAVLMVSNTFGNTPLHIAAEHGNAEAVQTLVSRHSSHEVMSRVNADGLNALHLAAQNGHTQVAHELLNELPNLVVLGDQDTGNAPLHYAAQAGHLAMVELLLARGADVNARNSFQQTPLHFAASWNESSVVHRLLECGADPLAVDLEGTTPLEQARLRQNLVLWEAMLGSRLRRAAAAGDVLAVLSSLHDGASPDLREDTSGDTVLHVAARAGQSEVIIELLANTADEARCLGLLNEAGDAALHVAARVGEIGAIKALLSTPEGDPDIPNADGDTALHIATAEGWVGAAEALVQCGANPNQQSASRGGTPLHDAACNCNLAMVDALLALGADPNALDLFCGSAPLHQVAMWGRPDESGAVAKALIQAGADPEIRNADGKTPRDLASVAEHRSVLETLPTPPSSLLHVDAGGSYQDKIPISIPTPTSNLISDTNLMTYAPPSPSAPSMPYPSVEPSNSVGGGGVGGGGLDDECISLSLQDGGLVGRDEQPVSSGSAPWMTNQQPEVFPMLSMSSQEVSLKANTSASYPSAVYTPPPPPSSPSQPEAISVPPPPTTFDLYPQIFDVDTSTTSVPPAPSSPLETPVPQSVLQQPPSTSMDIPMQRPMMEEPIPCVALQSVKASGGPAPKSPFNKQAATAAAQASEGVSSEGKVDGQRPTSPSAGAAFVFGAAAVAAAQNQPPPQNSEGSTGAKPAIDDRLLIPYNQLKYNTRDRLGQGSFGIVYRGILHGQKVAIKVLRVPEEEGTIALPQKLVDDWMRELHVMAGLRHDHIQDLRGHCLTPEGPAIVSKYYARGSMADVLRQGLSNPERRGDLTWARRLQMAVDIAAGMMYLHAHSPAILHRDLKAINCFLDEHWRALVGDFGLTKQMQERNKAATSSGAATNPRWLAPELLTDTEMGDSHYTTKTDVFAFGCTLYEMLTWKAPWWNTIHWEILNRVGRGERPALPARLPGPDNEMFESLPAFIDLMNRCWAQDPSKRPEFDEIHPFLEGILSRHMENMDARAKSGAAWSTAVQSLRQSGVPQTNNYYINAPGPSIVPGSRLGPMGRAVADYPK